MSVALTLTELLDYSDYERAKWKAWVQADPARLNLPFQAGARFPTLWSLLEHVFLVERRHLARLEGGTPPDSTGVAAGDWAGLFEYADLVRADLRQYVTGLDRRRAATTFSFTIPMGSFHDEPPQAGHAHRASRTAPLGAGGLRPRVSAAVEPPGEHDIFFFPGIA